MTHRLLGIAAIVALLSMVAFWAWGLLVIGGHNPGPFWWTYWTLASSFAFASSAIGWGLTLDSAQE